MIIKQLLDEDFVNYKEPSMFIGMKSCDFKCCKDGGFPISTCQNCELMKAPDIDVLPSKIVKRYIKNPITKAIVFGGMEPMLQAQDLYSFMRLFRKYSDDPIIVYTGYNRDEIEYAISCFEAIAEKNVIVKFGRYVPGQKPHYDPVLGVNLASDNQYGEVIC